MSNYQNGKIFELVSKQTKHIYIGATVCSIEKIFEDYKNMYKQYTELGIGDNMAAYKILKYKDCRVVLYEKYPALCFDELESRKTECIIGSYEICVNVNITGMSDGNITLFQHREEMDNFTLLQYENEVKKTKLNCSCGSVISERHFARHCLTQKHKLFKDKQKQKQL